MKCISLKSLSDILSPMHFSGSMKDMLKRDQQACLHLLSLVG